MVSLMASADRASPTGAARIFVDVGADVERDVGDHAHQALELIVAGDEIGFRIDLDDHALVAGDRDADQPLGGDAPGFLGRLGEALLAQPIDRGLQIAARFRRAPPCNPSCRRRSCRGAP